MKTLFAVLVLALGATVSTLFVYPSIGSAAPVDILSTLNPVILVDAPADQTMPQKASWGQVKVIYRGPLTPTAAEQAPEAARRPQVGPFSIGSPPNFVRNECWYALNHDWLYRGDDPNGPGGDGTQSNYNWLSKNVDANANGLRFVLHKYGGYVSDLIPGVGGDLTDNQENYYTDQLSSDSYALGFKGSSSGHGCQCVSFVAMILYRATGGRVQLSWNWASMNSGYPSATSARPGDVVFHTSGTHHVGICVINYGTGITIVDSNSLGNEVIRRHNVSNSEINNVGWKVMSGAGVWN